MRKPNDYDSTQAYTQSKALPAGGYVCVIKKLEETTSKRGNAILKVFIDIAEGEYANFFMEKWANRKRFSEYGDKANYPIDGTSFINCYDNEGNTNRTFKSFIEAFKASGNDFEWGERFEEQFRNGKIGIIFGREENEYNGRTYWKSKAKFFTTVEAVRTGDYTVPDDVPLDIIPQGMSETDFFQQVDEALPF